MIEEPWYKIIHDDCDLPIELCVCPTVTWEHHKCELCEGFGTVPMEPGGVRMTKCYKCEGFGEYSVATGDIHPLEIK